MTAQETHPETIERLQRFAARQPEPASPEEIDASMPIQREAGRSAEADFSSPVAADQVQIPVPAAALPQIEARFKASLDRYANERIPTGRFLRAVLENRLMEAWQRADPAARVNLEWILGYVIWEIPANCWGSPEIVAAWLKGGAS